MSARTIFATVVLLAATSSLAAQQTPPRAAAPVSAAARAANQGGARPATPPAGAPAAAPAATAPAQRNATPATQRPAAPARPQAPATRDTTDTSAASIDYRREVYSYQGASRDPFASLLNEASSQTTIADLRLVSVIYDARGGRSVAVVREKNNPRPYRLRRGDSLGRLRVIQIRPYEVVFQVEEFGFERQEVLALSRPEVNR